MEREVRIVYEDNARVGDWEWEASMPVTVRGGGVETMSGFGHSPIEALEDLKRAVNNS